MVGFFDRAQENKIISAIRVAEKNTSGEIRVHLHKEIDKDLMRDAKLAFRKMGMHKTKARNGVLIFLVPEAKQFAIIGDKGIDKATPADFWETTRDIMQQYFRKGDFAEGVIQGVAKVGEELKAYFPYADDDENELPDEISYSE